MVVALVGELFMIRLRGGLIFLVADENKEANVVVSKIILNAARYCLLNAYIFIKPGRPICSEGIENCFSLFVGTQRTRSRSMQYVDAVI